MQKGFRDLQRPGCTKGFRVKGFVVKGFRVQGSGLGF